MSIWTTTASPSSWISSLESPRPLVQRRTKAGRPAGFRVVEVRAGSLLAGLGLLRGDVLHSINGLELTSMEKAMEVYLKLKSAGHLALVVERGGVMTTLEYAVR